MCVCGDETTESGELTVAETQGEFVRRRREERGLSRPQLRRIIKEQGGSIHLNTIANIENDPEYGLTVEVATMLAKALDLNIAQTNTLMRFASPRYKARVREDQIRRLAELEAAVAELRAQVEREAARSERVERRLAQLTTAIERLAPPEQ